MIFGFDRETPNLYLYTGGSSTLSSSQGVKIQEWNHVAATFQSSADGSTGNATFYINLAIAGGGIITPPAGVIRSNSWIGRSYNWPSIDGLLDASWKELKIFSRSLSQADLQNEAYKFYTQRGKCFYGFFVKDFYLKTNQIIDVKSLLSSVIKQKNFALFGI